jgi:flagellin
MSLNAQRNLGKSQGALANSMQRLSSGLRINSAKDDAAGLAIFDRMTFQIRGLNQAARNANDGISLAQTAEGALQESTNILQRMRELAVQSANDTNSDSDHASLQSEIVQLQAELSRIAETTQFNGKTLLDGTMNGAVFQIGANAGTSQTITVAIDSAKAEDLSQVGSFIAAHSGITIAGGDVSGAPIAANSLKINGQNMGATDGTNSSLASAINMAVGSTIATAENVQLFDFTSIESVSELGTSTLSATTSGGVQSTLISNGLTVTAGTVGAAGDDITITVERGAIAATESGTLTFPGNFSGIDNFHLDGMYIEFSNALVDENEVVAAIVSHAGGTTVGTNFQITGTKSGNWVFSNSAPNDKRLEFSAAAAGDIPDLVTVFDHGLAGDVPVTLIQGADAEADGVVGGGTDAITVTVADANWGGYDAAAIAGLLNGTATASGGALTATGDTTGATAFGPTHLASGEDEVAGSSLLLSGLNLIDFSSLDNVDLLVDASAVTVNLTGVGTIADLASAIADTSPALSASYDGTSITITSTAAIMTEGSSGVLLSGDTSMTFSLDGTDNVSATDVDGDGAIDASDAVTAITAASITGVTASLNSDGQVEITKAAGANFTLTAAQGFSDVSTETTFYGQISLDSTADITFEEVTIGALAAAGLDSVGNSTTTIDQLDISSREGATTAISSVDLALAAIDNIRGDLGAVQNRFESTIANLRNVSENLSAARSRILDADIAQESSNLTKQNILQQAGVSILAQANQAPQLALSLLD